MPKYFVTMNRIQTGAIILEGKSEEAIEEKLQSLAYEDLDTKIRWEDVDEIDVTEIQEIYD